jgi:hypothetical protein
LIKDLKELATLLKLCRKQGVTEITLDGTVIKFGDLPARSSESSDDAIPTDELTPEQLAFYSVMGEQ